MAGRDSCWVASVSDPSHGLCPDPLPVSGLGRRAHTPPARPVPLPLTLAGLHATCARTQLFSVPLLMGRTRLGCFVSLFSSPPFPGFCGQLGWLWVVVRTLPSAQSCGCVAFRSGCVLTAVRRALLAWRWAQAGTWSFLQRDSPMPCFFRCHLRI